MALVEIWLLLYTLATLFAITMCYREQRQLGQTTLVFNMISVLACIVWPLSVALLLFTSARAAEDSSV